MASCQPQQTAKPQKKERISTLAAISIGSFCERIAFACFFVFGKRTADTHANYASRLRNMGRTDGKTQLTVQKIIGDRMHDNGI